MMVRKLYDEFYHNLNSLEKTRERDDYLPVFEKFRDKAEWYMREMEKDAD